MLPVRDTVPSSRVPVVNYALIAANVAVFLYSVSLGGRFEAFLFQWGLVPRRFAFQNLFTSMFLHGGWGHLLGNMLYLWIFGDNVEDRLGHGRYVAFYLLCGMFAGAAQAITAAGSTVPMVGASGAIAGVLGAYMLFFPGAQVVTLVWFFFFLRVVEIPALFLLAFWFIMQFLSGVGTLGHGAQMGGVAFWAHIGGFVIGMILGPALRLRSPPARWV